MKRCFFDGWPDAGPCDGRLIKAHLVKRQVLRREFDKPTAKRLIASQDSWVWCCGGAVGLGGHHGRFDGHRLRIPRHCLPVAFVDMMTAVDMDWYVDRYYPDAT